ncbi:MAG: CRISPR-associated protein Cas4 [Clostridiaceae bacterium]|nr:CRISPR-associated protein Cas4 [Clostridiaceae bacterium]
MYDQDQLLMLSGIQHFCFCERQWSLIHIEQQWKDNVRTVEGHFFHERVDNPFITETRGDLIVARSVPLVSYKLGLYGIGDVVEFNRTSDQGIILNAKEGVWMPYPVEYKAGRPKKDKRDEVQLCAQAICLEEMLDVNIMDGALFYGLTRRRIVVKFDEELRGYVKELANKMHTIYEQGITPRIQSQKHCKLCSLNEICMPKLSKKRNSVKNYMKKVNEDLDQGDDIS